MAAYIFLPIPTKEMTNFGNEIARSFAKSGPMPKIVRNMFASGFRKGFMRAVGQGCLKALQPTDTLYFVSHGTGAADSKYVGADRAMGSDDVEAGGHKWKKYTPSDVARILEGEGLVKNFRDLHMLTCGSGLEGNQEGTRDSIASRVWSAMNDWGYLNICVTGYRGDIKAGAGDQGFMVDRMRGSNGRFIGRLAAPAEGAVRFPPLPR